MALAARPKPTVSHKKRQAQHHRHNKPYLKTYWPYLPMLVVLGGGALINQHWPSSLVRVNPTLSASSRPLTRLGALTGFQAGWLTIVVGLVAVAALVFFMSRHVRQWQRVVVRGERFINDHPLLDIAVVFIFTAGFVLTRTAGLIR